MEEKETAPSVASSKVLNRRLARRRELDGIEYHFKCFQEHESKVKKRRRKQNKAARLSRRVNR